MNVNDLEASKRDVYNVSIVIEDTSLHNPHVSKTVSLMNVHIRFR